MEGSSPTLPSQRHLFNIPRDVTYVNCAYFGPVLNRVRETGRAAIDRRVSPWTIDRARFFDEVEHARALFAQLIGAEADAVSIAPSSSYAIAVAAANVPIARSQNVVVPQHEHPSNF